MDAKPKPRVIILGAGFAGLYAAKALKKAPVEVTVIDRSNHHLFQPLLYQVATAGLSATEIAQPIRKILKRQKNTTVLYAQVDEVDPQAREVVIDDGSQLPYDYLLVATGATHSYFGNDDWERHAPGLKQLEDALDIRRRILLAFEMAERTEDPEEREAYLTFVVIGAGPTGAELAGALADIAKKTVVREFRRFDPRDARVLLIEGMDRVLPPYPPELSAKAQKQLEDLGVEVRTGTRVTRVDDDGVDLGEERIAARTVLWAAGVQASSLGAKLGAETDRAGRVKVAPDLSLPEHPEVFVLGDLATLEQDNGEPVPGVAPAAIQMGKHAVKNLRRLLAGKESVPFRYRDKGNLATLGRKAAVADFGKLRLSGLPAWLAWLDDEIREQRQRLHAGGTALPKIQPEGRHLHAAAEA